MFSSLSGLMVPIYGLMILAPTSKLTRGVVNSRLLPFAASLLYAYALYQLWDAGLASKLGSIVKPVAQNFQNADIPAVIQGLAGLFKIKLFTVLAWAHLLLLDVYQARHILLDGAKHSVVTGHSIALSFMFGPLGFMSHIATKAVSEFIGRRQRRKQY